MFTSLSLLNKMIMKDNRALLTKFTLPNEGSTVDCEAWQTAKYEVMAPKCLGQCCDWVPVCSGHLNWCET